MCSWFVAVLDVFYVLHQPGAALVSSDYTSCRGYNHFYCVHRAVGVLTAMLIFGQSISVFINGQKLIVDNSLQRLNRLMPY